MQRHWVSDKSRYLICIRSRALVSNHLEPGQYGYGDGLIALVTCNLHASQLQPRHIKSCALLVKFKFKTLWKVTQKMATTFNVATKRLLKGDYFTPLSRVSLRSFPPITQRLTYFQIRKLSTALPTRTTDTYLYKLPKINGIINAFVGRKQTNSIYISLYIRLAPSVAPLY